MQLTKASEFLKDLRERKQVKKFDFYASYLYCILLSAATKTSICGRGKSFGLIPKLT